MTTIPPSSPQFELRHSTSAMVDLPVPKYMAVDFFCKRYGAAINEIEIVGIDGRQFVDIDSMQARMIIARAHIPDDEAPAWYGIHQVLHASLLIREAYVWRPMAGWLLIYCCVSGYPVSLF